MAREIRIGAQDVGEGRQDERRIAERREVDEPNPVRVPVRSLGREREREAGLADAAGAGHGNEPCLVPRDETQGVDELLLPPDERVGGNGQVRAVEASERREVA